MNALVVISAVLLALLLLSMVRIGAIVEYGDQGLLIWGKLGPARMLLFPLRKKRRRVPKAKPPKKQEKKTSQAPGERPGGSFQLLRQFLPLVGEAAGRFKRKIQVDKLYLDITTAAPDPAAAALGFGLTNAAVGMIWPVLEHNFLIRQRRIRTKVDFQRVEPVVFLHAQATLTIGQGVALALSLALQFLRRYRAFQSEQKTGMKQKEAVSNVGK